jgi:hypothetical protein
MVAGQSLLEVHTLFVPYLQMETLAQVVVHGVTPVTEQVPSTAGQGKVAEHVPVTEQVPGSCGQLAVTEQMVLWSLLHWPCWQSSSERQMRDVKALQIPCTPPWRQFTPLSQSTPASVLFWNWPPGTPVIEPEVSRTMSMLALRIWRSMTTSGFTRALAGGAMVQASTAASTPRAHSSIFSLGDQTARPARRAMDFTGRDIGGTARMIEENSVS